MPRQKRNKGEDGPMEGYTESETASENLQQLGQVIVVTEVHGTDEGRTENDQGWQEVLGAKGVAEANEVDVPEEDESDGDGDVSRRARLSKRINDEAVEDDLVDWLREHPVLWDSAHRDFRMAKKKMSMWSAKAKELDKSGVFLKGWYKDLRDHFVKLRKDKLEKARRFTYREKWVLDRFEFLAHTVRNRRRKNPCAIRSVAATRAMGSGNLEQEEHISVMDHVSINSADGPMTNPYDEAMARKKKKSEYPSLMEVTRLQLSVAQTQVLQLQQQLTEPKDKRASYLEYFKSVVKDITEEEWEDYHKLSVELEFKWQRNAEQRRQHRQYLQQ